ncbi:ABC transporter ATP-binding protein [Sulfidibacter corallicola]|uniref:ABC transporter ATP-binding protein n=1 Tax=Sulfidibacter corallicola TaxID=2818388 RepID=UPI001F381563|nr:ABC transporter ATP-binding protein [Sulfidibacter corallicola]
MVEDLKRYFGETKAVDGISFSIEEGAIYGFVGPNGAGKTTTMRIMATLDEPTSGDVRIGGVSIIERPEQVRRYIGFMPDALPNHRDMTITEYLDFFARAHGIKGPQRARTLTDVQAFTGVTPIQHKSLNQLSKGMKQRVSLARALIHDPQFLIMDEPAAGLDPKARVELRELIRALARQGKSIFISSHILGELTEICDGTVIIEQGRLLRAGKIHDLLHQDQPHCHYWIAARCEPHRLLETCMTLPLVEEVEIVGQEVRVQLPLTDEAPVTLLNHLVTSGLAVHEFRRQRADLEQMFMKVTAGKIH